MEMEDVRNVKALDADRPRPEHCAFRVGVQSSHDLPNAPDIRRPRIQAS